MVVVNGNIQYDRIAIHTFRFLTRKNVKHQKNVKNGGKTRPNRILLQISLPPDGATKNFQKLPTFY